jgi:hypothetical protein
MKKPWKFKQRLPNVDDMDAQASAWNSFAPNGGTADEARMFACGFNRGVEWGKARPAHLARPIVIIESPFAGNVELNLAYLRAAMHDCLLRGEAPFASHGLYTQPGVLDDGKPEERTLGIEAGFAFRYAAQKTVVYVDLGMSRGMQLGIQHTEQIGCTVERRTLPGWSGVKAMIDAGVPVVMKDGQPCATWGDADYPALEIATDPGRASPCAVEGNTSDLASGD